LRGREERLAEAKPGDEESLEDEAVRRSCSSLGLVLVVYSPGTTWRFET
jgi:hypothetical protein